MISSEGLCPSPLLGNNLRISYFFGGVKHEKIFLYIRYSFTVFDGCFAHFPRELRQRFYAYYAFYERRRAAYFGCLPFNHIKEGLQKMKTIKELRRACKMTQKAFAEYFGIPQRTIEDWDSEKHTPPEYLVKLIEYKLEKEKLI